MNVLVLDVLAHVDHERIDARQVGHAAGEGIGYVEVDRGGQEGLRKPAGAPKELPEPPPFLGGGGRRWHPELGVVGAPGGGPWPPPGGPPGGGGAGGGGSGAGGGRC